MMIAQFYYPRSNQRLLPQYPSATALRHGVIRDEVNSFIRHFVGQLIRQ